MNNNYSSHYSIVLLKIYYVLSGALLFGINGYFLDNFVIKVYVLNSNFFLDNLLTIIYTLSGTAIGGLWIHSNSRKVVYFPLIITIILATITVITTIIKGSI